MFENKNILLNSLCPACGAEGKQLQGSLDTFLKSMNKVFNALFFSCDQCGHSWMGNPPTKKELNLYYQSNPQYRGDEIRDNIKQHLNDQMAFIGKIRGNKKNVRFLEVGADTGQFLDVISNSVDGSDIYFEELNKAAADRLIAKGYKIFDTKMEVKFDYIVLTHLLEHIINPVKFLNHYKKYLVDGGEMFIEVPDFTLMKKGSVDPFMFEHLHYFSLKSLQIVAGKAGLDIARVEIAKTDNYRMTPNYVLRIKLTSSPEIEIYNIQTVLDKSKNKISRIIDWVTRMDAEPIALYGAGWLTTELLARLPGDSAIKYIFDGDPEKKGNNLAGYQIRSPEDISNSDFSKILIMSTAYEKEIYDIIERKNVAPQNIYMASDFIEP